MPAHSVTVQCGKCGRVVELYNGWNDRALQSGRIQLPYVCRWCRYPNKVRARDEWVDPHTGDIHHGPMREG